MRKTKDAEKPKKDESADYFMMGFAVALIMVTALAAEVKALRAQQSKQQSSTKSISNEPNKTELSAWLFLQSSETPCKAAGQSIPYYLDRSRNNEI